MRDLQIDWLKCFLAVVDKGSLSSAAPDLNRSQSAVSMQLKKLEDALQCELIQRSNRHIQLTPQGELLLGYARRMMDVHHEIHSAFNNAPLSGRIRLGVPDDYASRYLTPVLKKFAMLHHKVEIELNCEQSTSLIPRIEAGDLDLALVSRKNPQQGTLVFHEPLVWVGSPQFDTWKTDPLQIAVYEDTSLAKRSAIQSLALQGKSYRVVSNSSSLAGHIAAVESGLAIAVFTRCSVPAHLKILGTEHGLGPLKPMPVAVYRGKHTLDSQAVSYLHDLLIATLRESKI